MSKVTDYIRTKTKRIAPQREITAGGHHFDMFNTCGVEVEVAELLYSLVSVWKPHFILETGTHLGISAAYMGLACKENERGVVSTYEVIPSLLKEAQALWNDIGVTDHVMGMLCPSLNSTEDEEIDFLFLDSEPQYRFDEFIKFWPLVREGGLIAIHDLHPSLGHHGNTHHKVYDWPYGYWQPKLGEYIKNHQVQMIHIPNPRGMVLMQKTKKTDENIRYASETFREWNAEG